MRFSSAIITCLLSFVVEHEWLKGARGEGITGWVVIKVSVGLIWRSKWVRVRVQGSWEEMDCHEFNLRTLAALVC
jgi:hypothetical protein